MASGCAHRKNVYRRGGSALVAGFLLLVLGCGQSEITSSDPTDPAPTTGRITVDTEPDTLEGPWTLAGPGNLTFSGRGDSTFASMAVGTYTLTWGGVPEWIPPLSQRRELAGGGSVLFAGRYSTENPFAGMEFGTDSTLEVVTWNLEQFAKNGLYTVDLAARALATMDVDIVALQEIQSLEYFGDLDDRLPGWTGYRAASAAYNVNLAFLYRDDGDWVTDKVEEIFKGYSREFPRPPLVLEGRFKGAPVVVINNHFKCCGDNFIGDDPWDEEVRRRDAGLLLDQYVRANHADSRVIIVGDMNDVLTDSPDRNVFNIFLDAPDYWRFVDLDIAQGPSSGWSFPGWPSHLDHILINAPLFAAADGPAAEVEVTPLEQGFPNGWPEYDRNLSDHRPVALKLVP